MRLHSFEELSEADAAYWRYRITSLENLVAELLMKNQSMRFVLEATKQERPAMILHGRAGSLPAASLGKAIQEN